MKLLRQFPLLAFIVVLLSIGGICAALESLALLLVTGTLAALSWYITEGPRGRTLPKWVSNILVIAVALSVLVDFSQNQSDPLGVLGRFTVWLTLIKLYERRTARDHAHLLGLGLIMMLVGCLQSSSLIFGVILAIYSAMGLYVLLLYQLYAADERRRATMADAETVMISRRPTVGRKSGFHFRAVWAGLGIVGIALSALLFIIFPRSVGRGMLGQNFLSSQHDARTGFSREIDLIRGGRITESRRAVMEVGVFDRHGNPVSSMEPLLLRGAVLDSYDDGKWSRVASMLKLETSEDGPVFLHGSAEFTDDVLIQEVDLVAPVNNIFGLYLPIAIETDAGQTIAFDPAVQSFFVSPESPPLRAYRVHSVEQPDDELVESISRSVALGVESTSRTLLQTSSEWNRVQDLAEDVLSRAGIPDRPESQAETWHWNLIAAQALANELLSGRYRYSLDVSDVVLNDQDPIDAFLLESRTGHCEFFASGLIAMCRSVGIESRVVTGYIAAEFDRSIDRYRVRECHAHAWVEVRTGESRFRPIDPTPPSALEPVVQSDPSLADRLDWFYQRMEGLWANGLIGFDDRAQARLLVSVEATSMQRISQWLQSLKAWLAQVNRAFRLGPAGYLWMGLVAFALIVAVIALIKTWRRIRAIRKTLHLSRTRFTESSRLTRQLGFYADMLYGLQRIGLEKPEWMPPLAYARRLAGAQPEIADSVERLSRLYYDARYGGRRLDSAEVATAREDAQQLVHLLRSRD